MPTCYGLLSNAMGQGQSHLVPDPSMPPKQSKQLTTTSTVSQKTLVVKSKKSARTDVSGRDETDSEDDMPISSKFKIIKEVADTATEAVTPSSKPQKKRILSKSRYHIPLKVQMKDTDIQTSNPDESSTPDALANPDVAKASPTAKIVEISWEKVAETASKLGFSHPLEKKRKAAEIVFKRLKKVKGSSPQEPESQSGSAATTEDPATQEPLNQSLGEGLAIEMVTQEPSSQSEEAGKATASGERLVEDTVTEGSTQEPLTQSVKATSEPQAPQEPLVANTDASLSNPDGLAPDDSGAPDAEPILIQPLRSRPMNHPITDSQDKLKGIAIPDPDVTHDTDANDSDDSDDDNNEEKDQLARVLKSSLGTNFGSSSTFMAGKANTGKDLRQDFFVPSEIDPAEQLRMHQWENEWYRSDESVSYPYALDHAYNAAKLIQNEDLKNHLKATTLLSKSLKHEIDYVKDSTDKVRTDISQSFTKVSTALQLRVVESQVKSIITEQSSINNMIDSLDTKVIDIQTSLALILNILSNTDVKKGEKVSQTKCTPDLVLRNNDDTGNDGGDKVLQGETSDAAVMKSTIQTSQSQTTQSTHVSDSRVKTVRTLVQSQILTEEQILTGDQIPMPGHKQTLATIPEGDEDVLIDNPEDASNLFQKFTTKDGRIVTLYHTDKRVQQLFARKALSIASEEYLDLSHEEFLRQQREMMESFNNPARGRGDRGRRGARRGRRGSSTQTVPRQTRSRGLLIEEISEASQNLIDPVIKDIIEKEDKEFIEEEPELRRRPRQLILCNTNQIEDSNPDIVPDNVQDPDESEILQEIDLLILSTVVDSHNKEVDEEEEARRREITRRTNRDFNLYVQRLKLSNRRLWRNPSRRESLLERSYAFEKEKDKKWKHISTLRCNTPINFQNGGIITSASSVVDLSDIVRSKELWLRMFSNLKQLTSNSRGGIGHRDAEYLNMSYVDPYSLTEIGGTLTSENLNNLLAVDIVIDCHDGIEKKEKLLYFMKDGSVKILSIQDLLMKTTQELKYVHYLLRWKNEVCKVWSDMILSTIRRRLDGNRNFNGDYTPMYLNQRGQDVEIQRGTAVKEVTFGMTQLTLNPDGKEIAYLLLEEHGLQRSSIQNLRAAIYQINEEDEELRNLKERLIQILEEKEENLLSNFLKMNMFYQRI
ncbi:hypothetical protein POM88_026399 [Heracleum sosnowskyi]|uniref:Uncharacterized protein n=1 Tax=Heracleum sosnowskyi TaxID=360622 RepID=A0AAD8I6S0_9APIA|nr:hypothetical protein POM88_026399 [Heracleum sosnowskyi]